jgi:hypothetical protein
MDDKFVHNNIFQEKIKKRYQKIKLKLKMQIFSNIHFSENNEKIS